MLTSKKTFKDRPWALLTAEFIIVMLSVLLALGLDSWRGNMANQKIADNALEIFEREIMNNQADIQKAYDFHSELVEEVRDGRMGVTLRTATIENSAWEVVQTTGSVSHIDFDTVDIASRIYELQRRYQRIEEASANIIYQMNFQVSQTGTDNLDEEQLRSALFYLVLRLLNAERDLLEAYDKYEVL